MSEIIITGGHLIDPSTSTDGLRDLLIRDGRIAAIELPGVLKGDHAIDATGQTIAPGFVDVHVHLREPGQTYKETIATGTNCAAAGGFTTVVAMPNTVPVNDTVDSLTWMLEPARNARVNLLAMPAATMGSMGALLSNFEALAKAGAVGFTDDGKPILEDPIMRAALLTAGRLGMPVSQHAEDTRLTGGCSMNAGPVAFRLGLRGMTVEAESNIVERDIRLVEDIWQKDGVRAHLHVQHVSTSKALEAIRRAKADGHTITCEAAPHHFALTDEAIGDFNTHAKMNPPLRAESDRQAVIAALLDGTVDCIATDHAPHAAHEKEVEFERAPNGITGLETALGLTLRLLVRDHGMPLARAIALLSTNPATLIHQQDRGTLRVGAPADIVLFEATTEWTYETAKTLSKSKNNPFDQSPMLGRITSTLIAGKTVYRDGKLV